MMRGRFLRCSNRSLTGGADAVENISTNQSPIWRGLKGPGHPRHALASRVFRFREGHHQMPFGNPAPSSTNFMAASGIRDSRAHLFPSARPRREGHLFLALACRLDLCLAEESFLPTPPMFD
jgi:hypothetical protein